MKKEKQITMIYIVLLSTIFSVCTTCAETVKEVSVVNSREQGYVVFAIFENGLVRTQAADVGISDEYSFDSEIIDYAIYESNFYLATSKSIHVIPVTENPLKSGEETKIWEAPSGVDIVSLSTTGGSEPDEVYVVFALTNKTVVSYFYDVSKIATNPISVNIIATGAQEPITTKPSYNIEFIAFGGSEFVYVFKQGNSNNAIWNHQFDSEIKQVKIHSEYLIIRTASKISIYNLNDIVEDREEGSEYTSNVRPTSPFIVYEDNIYYEYQVENEWNLMELELNTWNPTAHKAALSGSMENLGFDAEDDVLYAVTKGPSIHAFKLNPYDEKWETPFTGKTLTTGPTTGVQDGTRYIFIGLTSDDTGAASVWSISDDGIILTQVISGEGALPPDNGDGKDGNDKKGINPIWYLVVAVIVITGAAGYIWLKDRIGRPKKEDDLDDLKDLL